LSGNPLQLTVSPQQESEVQVSSVDTTTDISTFLMTEAPDFITGHDTLGKEKIQSLMKLLCFWKKESFPKMTVKPVS